MRIGTSATVLDGIPRQDISDYPDLVTFLDYELKADVLNELDHQILIGDGTGGNFEGIFYTDGVLVQSCATAPSATIRRAMARVEGKGYANTALLFGPIDFAGVELELDGARGQYRGMTAPTVGRSVWGVPTIAIPTMPAGLAVVGDLRQAILRMRDQMEVRATDVAGEDFRRNQCMFRGELRAAFGVPVPPALALIKLNGTVTLPHCLTSRRPRSFTSRQGPEPSPVDALHVRHGRPRRLDARRRRSLVVCDRDHPSRQHPR